VPNVNSRQLRRHRPRGFTLLELVLVMVVLAIALAITVPSLRGFLAGSRARDAVSQIVSLAQYARARAAADATVYRLNVDGAAYWLTAQQGEAFVPVGTEFGKRFELPAGTKVKLVPTGASATSLTELQDPFDPTGIPFYADGRTGPGLIQVSEPDGTVTLIASVSPTDSFRVVTPEEAARL
jgi:prepilin-type N-terminal cleavage/methylation domain-containing protein